jgi:hypothetical protein
MASLSDGDKGRKRGHIQMVVTHLDERYNVIHYIPRVDLFGVLIKIFTVAARMVFCVDPPATNR